MNLFKVITQDKLTAARVGILKTPHGEINTPAFIPVGTAASVKSLTPEEIKKSGTEIFFVNTYHLYLRPGDKIIKNLGGVHKFMSWEGPLISDSGGFQVFSLAKDKEAGLVKITDKGIHFCSYFDGSSHFFGPRKVIEIQKNLGADIILPLDECTFYPAIHQYTRQALERTHRWAKESLAAYQKLKIKKQVLFGIIQGGVYQDLRIESARFISSLPFAGFAIGGVSVGESKEKMQKVISWVLPYLPPHKPRHLLGVGEIDDIFNIIEQGIDTFDCVYPTRMGRMGKILISNIKYQKSKIKKNKWEIDITKTVYQEDKRPLDEHCSCFVCHNFTRAYIHHLFRARELLAYRLATFHNLFFIQNLVSQIRKAIKKGKFAALKKEWLSQTLYPKE